jgi:hypothetical protein
MGGKCHELPLMAKAVKRKKPAKGKKPARRPQKRDANQSAFAVVELLAGKY